MYVHLCHGSGLYALFKPANEVFSNDITLKSLALGWYIFKTSSLAGLYNAYRSRNHYIYDITNHQDLHVYLLNFSPPFWKAHLLILLIGSTFIFLNGNLVRGLYSKYWAACMGYESHYEIFIYYFVRYRLYCFLI